MLAFHHARLCAALRQLRAARALNHAVKPQVNSSTNSTCEPILTQAAEQDQRSARMGGAPLHPSHRRSPAARDPSCARSRSSSPCRRRRRTAGSTRPPGRWPRSCARPSRCPRLAGRHSSQCCVARHHNQRQPGSCCGWELPHRPPSGRRPGVPGWQGCPGGAPRASSGAPFHRQNASSRQYRDSNSGHRIQSPVS